MAGVWDLVPGRSATEALCLLAMHHVEAHPDDDPLVAEVRRLRAENARLDAILWALNEHTPTIVDDEFGFRLLGRGCEHPSLTGDRCDACGWTQAWEAQP